MIIKFNAISIFKNIRGCPEKPRAPLLVLYITMKQLRFTNNMRKRSGNWSMITQMQLVYKVVNSFSIYPKIQAR